MPLDDKLRALRDDSGPAQTSAVLREIVHDLNNLLGSIALESDTLDRLATVLEKLSEQEGDRRLAKSARILSDSHQTVEQSLEQIQALLQKVSQASSDLA